MRGLFGDMFDFDHDGELDTFERAMELECWEELNSETDYADDDEEETELEMSGLDPMELEFMDSYERREALEESGLDPDEYDF